MSSLFGFFSFLAPIKQAAFFTYLVAHMVTSLKHVHLDMDERAQAVLLGAEASLASAEVLAKSLFLIGRCAFHAVHVVVVYLRRPKIRVLRWKLVAAVRIRGWTSSEAGFQQDDLLLSVSRFPSLRRSAGHLETFSLQ